MTKSKKYTLEALRNRYPVFTYESFCWDISPIALNAKFTFKIGSEFLFHPELSIPLLDEATTGERDPKTIDNLIFHLGLIEMLSYWKAFCSPTISIKAGSLNHAQLEWWETLILRGMGEYFFVNKIDFKQPNFLRLVVDCKQVTPSPKGIKGFKENRSLVLTSGGKDTALTLAILAKTGQPFSSLFLNATQAARELATQFGSKKEMFIQRSILPELLTLNHEGYLNGHTPFSAYLAFLGVACGLIWGYDQIIVSNERSSNEGNVEFLGDQINHQYSKTFEFECMFQDYVQEYITNRVHYFSFLRPLYEIQIAQLLAEYPEALNTFKSCNKNQIKNSWCGHCPKCVSVYVMIYPFITEDKVRDIFGRDLFDDESVIHLVKELAGLSEYKPFECVGTQKETIAGLYLGLEKVQNSGTAKLPAVWEAVKTEILPRYPNAEKFVDEVLLAWGESHSLPLEYESILRKQLIKTLSKTLAYATN